MKVSRTVLKARQRGDSLTLANKAITGGTKYAIRSFFCLPSEDDPERTPSKLSVRLTSDRHRPDPQLLEQTTTELKRLGWSNQQGRLYLENTFGKSSRQHLTKPELQQFLQHLRSLPLPEPQLPKSVVEANAALPS